MAHPLVFSPLILAGLGFGVERVARARDSHRYQEPGDLMDVGGHKLHYEMQGAHHLEKDAGAPVILFEADAADWSSHWGGLPAELAKSHTVIAYDRAGLGWSEPGTGTRDADTLAKELHQLLMHIVPGRRALLVAHGQGTWVARMYAHRYPFETAGMVLLDGEHEGFADLARRRGLPSAEASSVLLRMLKAANGVGLCRAFRMELTVPQIPGDPYPDRLRKAMASRGYSASTLSTILAEQEAKASSREQLLELKDQFEFPVRILAAGTSTREESAPKGFPVAEYNELFAEQQRKWQSLSPDAAYALVENGHHYLALGAPDWVKDGIEDALAAAPRSPDATP